MARKLASDAIHLSATPALAALTEYRNNLFTETQGEIDLLSILRDNLPTVTGQDETGQDAVFSVYGLDDETGAFVLDGDNAPDLGSLAIVTLYDGEIAAQEGEPLARPVAVYLLNLPKISEAINDERLATYRENLIARDYLARARSIAKADYTGNSPLIRDRIAALIAASSRGGSKIGKAYDAIFPVLQGAILRNITAKAKALAEAGQHGQARLIRDTFSKARLNKQTLQECLSSAAAAKMHFAGMPQAQWVNLLKIAIAWAPKHQVQKIVKDEAGNNVKTIDAETGKERVIRELVAAPQSPAIFQQWLDTRDETEAKAPDMALDLGDLTLAA